MKFSYEIVSVNENAKSMDVRFTADGHAPFLVGVPMPKVGEDIREIMAAFAPISMWQQRAAEVQSVTAGATGEVWGDHPTETPEEFDARIAAEAEADEIPE
jgi:hypothetical protein